MLDVISARTADGLQLALSDLRGDLSRRVQPARVAIVSLLAYLDAAADFPDDEIPGTDVDADLDVACAAWGMSSPGPGPSVDSGWRAGCPGRAVPMSARAACSIPCCEASVPSLRTSRHHPRCRHRSAVIDGGPVTLLDTPVSPKTAVWSITSSVFVRQPPGAGCVAAALLVLDGSMTPGARTTWRSPVPSPSGLSETSPGP